jgi:hypothetical protein
MQARKRHTFTLLFRTRTKEGKDERFTRIQREKKKKRLFVRRRSSFHPVQRNLQELRAPSSKRHN